MLYSYCIFLEAYIKRLDYNFGTSSYWVSASRFVLPCYFVTVEVTMVKLQLASDAYGQSDRKAISSMHLSAILAMWILDWSPTSRRLDHTNTNSAMQMMDGND